MRLFTPSLAAAVLWAGVVMGQPAAPAVSTDPAAAQAGTYSLEPVHTRVLFSVSHLGLTRWYGDFSRASGVLVLDPRDPAVSRVEVSVPIASVSTTNATLDAELEGADWFDAAKWPTAVFKSRRVTLTGAGRALIEGDLTLHGITAPLTLEASFNGAGANPFDKSYAVGFDAVGKLKRADFGIAKDIPFVGDEVSLIISAAFVRKP
jgi:polyisoprenoid-binding protein YceI